MQGESNPIIVGVGQYKQGKETKNPLDPLNLINRATKKAIKDTAVNKINNFIDHIYMVNINSWSYADAPTELCQTLGINPKNKIYMADGGNTPQMLVNRGAKKIARGKASLILVCGGEASYSLYQSRKGKVNLKWPEKKKPSYMEGEIWHGINEFENKYKLIIPSYTYALFETALRYSKKRSIKEHNKIIGDLFHKFSKIADENPYSWAQKVYKSEEIITPSSQNRLINHPYTKRMCSNMFVDLSAAIIITSENLAKRLGIDQHKWVYPMGGADYDNIFSICQRPNLNNSPAARFASRESLRQAGLKIKDIDSFDIYSCFHSIVEIIKDEVGIPEEDERDLTITGGLPYFGGPWSNYSLHAIARAVDLIREEPNKKIMVIANGGYNTKQSFGIYGREPPKISWNKKKSRKYQDFILNNALQKPIKRAKGTLTVEGYTLIYNKKGKPGKGIFVGTLKGRGIKTLATMEEGLERLEETELVGCNFPIQYNTNLGYNTISFNSEILNQDEKIKL